MLVTNANMIPNKLDINSVLIKSDPIVCSSCQKNGFIGSKIAIIPVYELTVIKSVQIK